MSKHDKNDQVTMGDEEMQGIIWHNPETAKTMGEAMGVKGRTLADLPKHGEKADVEG